MVAVLAGVSLVSACGDSATATAPASNPPRPTTVEVNPATAELTALGASIQLNAEVRDQNGRVMAGTAVAWASSSASVATVDRTGLVTAAGDGTAVIAASVNERSEAVGTGVVTVMQLADSVFVSPAAENISLGNTKQMLAEAFDVNGHMLLTAEFSWASSDRAVATVNARGLVRGVAKGMATIAASVGSAQGTAQITVVDNPDRAALVALYDATDGPNWTHNENWLEDVPLGEWHGVDTDASGRVVSIVLRQSWDNEARRWMSQGLAGPIPAELGNLASLAYLYLDDNALTGAIPAQLGNLASLRSLWLPDNVLTGPIPPELGNLASLRSLWLNYNTLTGAIPSELGNLASLRTLHLDFNDLTGAIPSELGNLANLGMLDLRFNDLTGSIPPELGSLASLRDLRLRGNALTGAIPSELANLANLRTLWLPDNALTGSIPPELGNLAGLTTLLLYGNDLTGAIPPELGNLVSLRTLWLENNDLTGAIPPELGRMSSLRQLNLTNNFSMAGSLPTELTALSQLEELMAGGTGLCVPSDPGFLAWLETVRNRRRIAACAGASMAYLTQAVQSREFPVPLVAGEKALLRVFPTTGRATGDGIPPVRARFYVDGRETYAVEIPGTTTPIPSEVDEGSLSKSANAEIPGGIVRPGLELVIEIDPEGTLDAGLGVARRIPEAGRQAVDVREMPIFNLTAIPFLWTANPDSAILALTAGMAADPEGHELLESTRILLPVRDLEVTAHEPVMSSSNNGYVLLDQIRAIRAIEGGTGHYMGMMSGSITGPSGVAGGDWWSFALPGAELMAHELGHNMGLGHAPCGGAGGPDPSYPYPGGSIGAWGYDFRDSGRLVPPGRPDLMGYCGPRWISDYHFTNALGYRLSKEGLPPPAVAARSLLVWGGVNAGGVPYLEPAFVVDAPPTLPDSTGQHRLTGRAASGGELFSLGFAVSAIADADGGSSFAFVLPVRPGWEGALSSITLEGPEGSVTLDGNSDRPMAILRDPRSGKVRAILRDLPQAEAGAALAPQADGLDVLFSRGIPSGAAWRR
ncbi:MAG: Ig-like domain-containing protein [Gammaproteobacteria bacterium]|nr:Ig-like domain-containing protein [Gammaproteobacteria bacterium]